MFGYSWEKPLLPLPADEVFHEAISQMQNQQIEACVEAAEAEGRREDALATILKHQGARKERKDAQKRRGIPSASTSTLKRGDLVLVHASWLNRRLNHKLEREWMGPFRIVARGSDVKPDEAANDPHASNVTFWLNDPTTGKQVGGRTHANRLKLAVFPEEQPFEATAPLPSIEDFFETWDPIQSTDEDEAERAAEEANEEEQQRRLDEEGIPNVLSLSLTTVTSSYRPVQRRQCPPMRLRHPRVTSLRREERREKPTERPKATAKEGKKHHASPLSKGNNGEQFKQLPARKREREGEFSSFPPSSATFLQMATTGFAFIAEEEAMATMTSTEPPGERTVAERREENSSRLSSPSAEMSEQPHLRLAPAALDRGHDLDHCSEIPAKGASAGTQEFGEGDLPEPSHPDEGEEVKSTATPTGKAQQAAEESAAATNTSTASKSERERSSEQFSSFEENDLAEIRENNFALAQQHAGWTERPNKRLTVSPAPKQEELQPKRNLSHFRLSPSSDSVPLGGEGAILSLSPSLHFSSTTRPRALSKLIHLLRKLKLPTKQKGELPVLP
jgi:hypothetical protein